ncbi:MAG: putative bifunctional diguanylate cyclase/phosphodiesterase [Gammaproteobacteria bacterium]
MDSMIQLDLERYELLFKHLTDVECKLELLDQRGNSFGEGLFQEAVTDQNIDWDSLCYKARKLTSTEGKTTWSTALFLSSEYRPYWLKLNVESVEKDISEETEKSLKLILVDTAHFLTDDYMNQAAIAGFSAELASRYEEINMVYGLDEVWKNSHKYDEIISYKELLQMSLNYLSVDTIALLIPNENISIYYENDQGLTEIEETLAKLKNNHAVFFDSAEKSLVVNRDAYSEDTYYEPTIPYKLIVSSVTNIDHTISGIVVFANSMEKEHYTNTDRRLCELLAREITKIFQSKRDPITGLFNRKSFENKLKKLVESQDNSYHSLVYFDIDRFQVVNDTWGHSEGDRLLRQIAALIRSKLGKNIIMSRLGGDEFGILLEDTSADVAEGIAEGLRRAIEELSFISNGQTFDISSSFGIAEINPDMGEMFDVLGAADVACDLVKQTGKNGVRVYQPSNSEMVQHHDQMYWASRIKTSLEEDLFEIFGQAIVPLSDPYGEPSHYEILVRLREENGEMVAPGRFIPAAEQYNLMPLLDRWVLKETLRTLKEAEEKDINSTVSVSVNISGQSLCDNDFLKYAYSLIIKSEINPERICLEITETSAVGDLNSALKFIETMSDLGCLFALDDFGSGMSSFGYLKHLPVDYLKLDGIFIKNIVEDSVDRVMVKSINYLAQEMGLKTIAEYVENENIVDVLQELKIDYAQGYGIDKPSPFYEKLNEMKKLALTV